MRLLPLLSLLGLLSSIRIEAADTSRLLGNRYKDYGTIPNYHGHTTIDALGTELAAWAEIVRVAEGKGSAKTYLTDAYRALRDYSSHKRLKMHISLLDASSVFSNSHKSQYTQFLDEQALDKHSDSATIIPIVHDSVTRGRGNKYLDANTLYLHSVNLILRAAAIRLEASGKAVKKALKSTPTILGLHLLDQITSLPTPDLLAMRLVCEGKRIKGRHLKNHFYIALQNACEGWSAAEEEVSKVAEGLKKSLPHLIRPGSVRVDPEHIFESEKAWLTKMQEAKDASALFQGLFESLRVLAEFHDKPSIQTPGMLHRRFYDRVAVFHFQLTRLRASVPSAFGDPDYLHGSCRTTSFGEYPDLCPKLSEGVMETIRHLDNTRIMIQEEIYPSHPTSAIGIQNAGFYV